MMLSSALVVPVSVICITVSVYCQRPCATCFVFLFFSRYARLFVGLWGYYCYKDPIAKAHTKVDDWRHKVTIVIATNSVCSSDNPDFEECLTCCFQARPAHIVITTDSAEHAHQAAVLAGRIQSELDATSRVPIVTIETAQIADKRQQLVLGLRQTTTPLALLLDDHTFLKPDFLSSTAAVFAHPEIGICGTRKHVRRQHHTYWAGAWNFLGQAYLERHNFELRMTSGLDRGVFVISARAMLVRTALVKSDAFFSAFLCEPVLPPCLRNALTWLGYQVPRYTRIGDDNFITNWITRMGYVSQYIDAQECAVETNLGDAATFIHKCVRWRRTTYLYNAKLLLDPFIWKTRPWTVCVAFLPALFNLALIWDSAMLVAFQYTDFYSPLNLRLLAAFIYFSKGIKLVPLFRRHPMLLFLYFFPFPVYHVWVYFHSFISLYSALTCWNQTWEG